MPAALARELRYQTFRRYCALNVALEASAEYAYRRLVQVAGSDEERVAFDRIRDDEARHAAAFRLLTDVLTDDDRLAGGVDGAAPGRAPGGDQPLVPARRPSGPPPWPSPVRRARSGPARRWWCAPGAPTRTRPRSLEECLDRAGLGELAAGARSAAIRVSFMLGYDRADRSNVNDPELVDLLARYLRRHGVADVAVLEAPTVYGNLFGNRSVASVAAYFGFNAPLVPDRRHRRGPGTVPVRPRVRAELDHRHLAEQRPADRDAEAAHRPDRVRAPEPVHAGGQHRRHRRHVLRRAAASTSGPRR